jgi:hypothetical protein
LGDIGQRRGSTEITACKVGCQTTQEPARRGLSVGVRTTVCGVDAEHDRELMSERGGKDISQMSEKRADDWRYGLDGLSGLRRDFRDEFVRSSIMTELSPFSLAFRTLLVRGMAR